MDIIQLSTSAITNNIIHKMGSEVNRSKHLHDFQKQVDIVQLFVLDCHLKPGQRWAHFIHKDKHLHVSSFRSSLIIWALNIEREDGIKFGTKTKKKALATTGQSHLLSHVAAKNCFYKQSHWATEVKKEKVSQKKEMRKLCGRHG